MTKVTSFIRLYPPFDIVSFFMYVKYLYLRQERINTLLKKATAS